MMNAHTEPHLVSSDTSVLVFVNRVAGRGRVQAYLQRIRDLFEFLHIAAEFLETGSASELESAARQALVRGPRLLLAIDRKSTRLNSSHGYISYAVFCLKKKKKSQRNEERDLFWRAKLFRRRTRRHRLVDTAHHAPHGESIELALTCASLLHTPHQAVPS